MGFLSGLSQAASDTFGMGADMEMKTFMSELERDRQLALEQARIKLQSDAKEAERVKRTDAITAGAQGIADKRQGLISAKTGNNDAEYRGGDENVGTNIQTGQAQPTAADMQLAQANYDGTGYDKINDNLRQDGREKREDAKAMAAARAQAAKDAIAQARLDLDGKKLDAMIAHWQSMGSKGGSVSEFVQDMTYLKQQNPNMTQKELEDKYVHIRRGKEGTWSKTIGQDKFGSPTESTTITGSGDPPTSAKPAGSGVNPWNRDWKK
jgi:hypothetical protein